MLRSPWLALLAVVALCGLRAVHLEADAPREITAWSVGVFVDEGYKTLDARNLVLYGAERWNPADNYEGWAARSPLVHALYRTAFELAGVRLEAARATTIGWLALLLGGLALTVRRRHGAGLALLAVVALGLQHTVFVFSRAALLELPLCACLYGLLFALAWVDDRRAEGRLPDLPDLPDLIGGPNRIGQNRIGQSRGELGALAVLALFTTGAALGIKASAPTYFAPVLLGLAASTAAHRRRPRPAEVLALAAAVLALAWLTRELWWARLDLDPADLPRRVLTGNFMHSSAALAALGLFCATHALWVAPEAFLRDRYRAGLIALVVVGPLLIALFAYRPLRYYVPFLPASILLAVEWVGLRTWRRPAPERVPPAAAVLLVPLATLFAFCFGSALHSHVLEPLIPGWGLPVGASRLWFALPLGLACAALWPLRRKLGPRAVALVFAAVLTVSAAHDLQVVGRFLFAPTREAQAIAQALERELPAGSVLAGDWAPMLTLGTSLRALYSNPVVNRVGRFDELRPDHFMFSGVRPWVAGDETDPREKLRRFGIDPRPVLAARYAGREVLVYRLDLFSAVE